MLKNRQTDRDTYFHQNRCGSLVQLLVKGLLVLLAFGFLTFSTGAVSAEAAGERPGEPGNALVNNEPAAAGDKDAGDGKRLSLKVGFVPLPGFFTALPGDLSIYDGCGYYLIQMMAAENGWEITCVPGTWEENIARLRSGEIDFFPEAPGPCENYPDIVGTNAGIATVRGAVIVSDDLLKRDKAVTAGAGANSLAQSGGEIPSGQTADRKLEEGGIALGGRSCSLGYVAAVYPGGKVPDKELMGDISWKPMEFYDMETLLRAFHEGRIDAYLDNSLRTNQTVRRNGRCFDSYECRLLVRRDRENLLNTLNGAVNRLMDLDPNVKEEAARFYYKGDETFVRPVYTGEELKYLREHPVLRASADVDQSPFSYMEDGVHKGILADLLKLVAADLGVTIEVLPLGGAADVTADISAGKADFLADISTDITWASRLGLNITVPYMDMSYAQLGRRGAAMPDKPVVASPRSYYFTHSFIGSLHKDDEVVYFDNWDSAVDAVASGHADIVYIKGTRAFKTMAEDERHSLCIRKMDAFSYPLSFGVGKDGDPRLFRVLNKAVCRLDPGIARQLSARHTAEDLQLTTGYRESLKDRKVLVWLGAFALMVLCGTGAYAYRCYRQREYLRIDPLTGYHNRRWLEEVMPGEYRITLEEAFREDQLFILTVGVTRIRSILETVGRQAIADKLKEILETTMRETRWAKLGVTSSAVGQIFVVCCFEDKSEILREITKIIHRHDYMEIAYGTVHPALKAGIAPVDNSQSFPEAVSEGMIKATAAYNTAFSGNETISVYEGNYSRQSVLQSKIEAVMEKALEKKEYIVFYQPKYELATGRIVGAESLVRWQSEELGFLNPGSFIDLFEKNGFILPLDYYMLEMVMMYQRRRLDLGLATVPVSVNQSRHHLTEPGYLDKMRELAQKYRLPDGAVELELTEAVFGSFDQLKYQKNAIDDFKKLRELGFAFSIDGFGSGYSSFRLLSQLPFNSIKIDKSLLRDAETSSQMQVVIAGIVDMGEKLDMAVLCEGIETVSQEQLLIKLGCKYGQGYLNGRPMPENEFDELLARKLGGKP